MESLTRMVYLTAFLKECLRTETPVPGILVREAICDHQLGEFKIKKGTYINLEFMVNNYSPEYYENPNKFDPERWIKNSSLADAFVFTPFSAGSRNCIGQNLAWTEARIIIAEFLRRYDFELVEGYVMKWNLRMLHEPLDPVKVSLKEVF